MNKLVAASVASAITFASVPAFAALSEVVHPTASASAPEREPDYAPSSCQEVKLAKYPANIGEGVRLHYQFYYDVGPEFRAIPREKRNAPSTPEFEKLLKEKGQKERARLQALAADTSTYWMSIDYMGQIYIEPQGRAKTENDINKTLVALCTMLGAPYQISSLYIRTDEEEIELLRKRIASTRHFSKAFRGQVEKDEAETLLREEWADVGSSFFSGETTFSRIRDHDFNCEYVERPDPLEDHTRCFIGVLATSQKGPEYQNAPIEFTRIRDRAEGPLGKLKRWSPEFTLIN